MKKEYTVKIEARNRWDEVEFEKTFEAYKMQSARIAAGRFIRENWGSEAKVEKRRYTTLEVWEIA